MLYCTVNGQKNDQISIADRALAYGDGVFSTAKIANGKVEMLEQHLERLKTSCQRLCIDSIDSEDFSQLETELKQVAVSFPLAVLKVLISAGQGGRGYSRKGIKHHTVIITVHEFPSHYQQWQQQGITVSDSQILLGLNPLFAGIKHLNRLEQVLIRKELDNSNFDDFLVYDLNHQLVEGSSSNVFWFKGEQLFTPELTHAGVAGLKRAQILQLYPQTQQVKVTKSALADIDAMFLCNCVMGIVPVRQYNQQILPITVVLNLQQQLASLKC